MHTELCYFIWSTSKRMSIENNNLSAQALEDYFSQLLTDACQSNASCDFLPNDSNYGQQQRQPKLNAVTQVEIAPPVMDVNLSQVEKLFEKLPLLDEKQASWAEADLPIALALVDEKNQATSVIASEPEAKPDTEQLLYFEARGITYAALLSDLGGIYRLEQLSSLFGQPAWFLGVQTERELQLNVVDLATWVTGCQAIGNQEQKKYQYVIKLGSSLWGLACDNLLGTDFIHKDQVRWRIDPVNRPWLSGLVKHRMCALLNVNSLVSMLNQGIDATI